MNNTERLERDKIACSLVDKILSQIAAKEEELHRREMSSGTSHDIRKMVRLRNEIEALERRLERAFRLHGS